MSEQNQTRTPSIPGGPTQPTAAVAVRPTDAAVETRARRERGMVTIEYAVGAVMVIALVAAIIVAFNQGWMGELSQGFAQFIFDQFKRALQLG